MMRVHAGTRVFAYTGLAMLMGAANAGAAGAPPKTVSCSGLQLRAATLGEALTLLGRERGFEVTIGNPAIGKLTVKPGLLKGPDCVAEMAELLRGLDLNFGLSEGPGKSIRRLIVTDFKSAPSTGVASTKAPSASPLPETPSAAVAEPVEETSPKPQKDKAPDPDELIDLGDGMKIYKVPPPYVPMTPGLIPPNAVLSGPEVLGETFFGTESEQINPGVAIPAGSPLKPAGQAPSGTQAPGGALPKAPPAISFGTTIPANVRQPATPAPTPHP